MATKAKSSKAITPVKHAAIYIRVATHEQLGSYGYRRNDEIIEIVEGKARRVRRVFARYNARTPKRAAAIKGQG